MEAQKLGTMGNVAPPQMTERVIPLVTRQLASANRRLLSLIEQLEEVNSRAFSSPTSLGAETGVPDSGISLESLSQEVANYGVLLDRLTGNIDQTEKII